MPKYQFFVSFPANFVFLSATAKKKNSARREQKKFEMRLAWLRVSNKSIGKTLGIFNKRKIKSQFWKIKYMHTQVSSAAEKASVLLPHQGILENFVHHNPLESLEHMPFLEAVEHSHEWETLVSPGERMCNLLGVDPRERVNEALVELSSTFLDRGNAKWQYKERKKGFLHFFAALENLGFVKWRRHARERCKRVEEKLASGMSSESVAEEMLREDLLFYGDPPEEWASTIHSICLDSKGWAGMFKRMESHPSEAPLHTPVRFIEFCAVKSILLRSSMEALALKSDWDGRQDTFSSWLRGDSKKGGEQKESASMHPSSLAHINQNTHRREALEEEFEEALLRTLSNNTHLAPCSTRPDLQVYTCIDDRECSFRRHVESSVTKKVQTFGLAGFFGVPVRYEPL